MIGLITAMNCELEAIRELLENEKEETYFSQTYYSGTISGQEVTMVEGGVGKVASAITCTRLIERFHCDMILNIGTAGGIKDFENVLDMVIVDRMTYHDWVSETINNLPSSFVNAEYVFNSDERLVEIARKTADSIDDHNASGRYKRKCSAIGGQGHGAVPLELGGAVRSYTDPAALF